MNFRPRCTKLLVVWVKCYGKNELVSTIKYIEWYEKLKDDFDLFICIQVTNFEGHIFLYRIPFCIPIQIDHVFCILMILLSRFFVLHFCLDYLIVLFDQEL